MSVTFPIVAALLMFFGSLVPGWKTAPELERVELRAGHGFARNDSARPSGFQLTHLLPSAALPTTRPIGPVWARGRIVWNPELQLSLFSVPNVRPLFGLHPLQFHYEFETAGPWKPYLLAGVGFIYSNIERPETGSDYNFSLVSGIGARRLLGERTAWLLEYRHHHISNNDTDDQNSGIDAETFLTGFSLSF